MDGFGPVATTAHEPFHDHRESELHAIRTILGVEGVFNVDQLRDACERVPPAAYLTAGYYGIRLAAIEELLAERDLLDSAELEGRASSDSQQIPSREDPSLRRRVETALAEDESFEVEPAVEPRFDVGDRVRVRNRHPRGHTRCPRYVRRARGEVTAHHGTQRYPDASATGAGPGSGGVDRP
jgi:nitrile hydratase